MTNAMANSTMTNTISSQNNNELMIEIRNHIAHLTLNRPHALNALTHTMVDEMTALLDTWAADDNINAIILRVSSMLMPASNCGFCETSTFNSASAAMILLLGATISGLMRLS